MERKTATIQVRLTPSLKTQAEATLDTLGLSPSSAIELFYKQIIAFKGLPFSPKVANPKTIKAMKEIEERNGRSYDSVGALMKDLGV